MNRIDVRDSQCENCRKFSHCNNNDLVCIKKFQQLKAENEELKNKNKEIHSIAGDLQQRNHNLTLEIESYEYQFQKRIEICDSWFCIVNKYKTALDEIDKILQEYHPLFTNTPLFMINQVIRQIKEVNSNE